MGDLAEGEETSVKGSGSALYTLKNSAGVYSCSCPAWRNQSVAIERRTCKHLRAFRGEAAEQGRVGDSASKAQPARASKATPDPAQETADVTEPPLLLAHKWESSIDITGWWLSEKLDGVRAYWDGTQFLSRLGNRFFAPPWFTAGLPREPLDGELWGGRKSFQRTVGIVKRQDESPLWKDLLFVVFDAPAFDGSFEERIAHCESLFGGGARPYTRVLAHEPCRGVEHLKEELTRVEALGGEGLMARRPKSRYEAGRSDSLLKVKTFHDAEARVVAHVGGLGRHAGRLGALTLELADGTRFNVGTGFSDREREDPPALGVLVTFRYQELSEGGVPRFPTFVGARDDVKGPSLLTTEKPASAQGPVPAPAAVVAAGPSSGARYFELVAGGSSKFWEIRLQGSAFTTRYGKLGTTGQSSTKEQGSPEQALHEHDKLVAEKTKKGYVEK